MALQNSTDAIQDLQAVTQSDTSRFQEPADWYLALAYLQQADMVRSQQILQKISQQPKHEFQDKAARLLSQFE